MRRARATAAIVATALVTPGLSACSSGETPQAVPGADAGRGPSLIEYYGCGACHRIGGIPNADGAVGPSLRNFDANRYISGNLPNTPENVAAWIENPQRFVPGTIMPQLGVTPSQAADIAAYLAGQ